jgi:hypothetical protein
MATVADFTRLGLGPQTHAYDARGLSPIEFLQAVYNDPSLPMSTSVLMLLVGSSHIQNQGPREFLPRM